MSNEVQRLQAVYEGYQSSAQRRWSHSNAGNQRIAAERDQQLDQLLKDAHLLPLSEQRILDLGCGNGDVLRASIRWGAPPEKLFGIDLLIDRVQAAHRNHPALSLAAANAEQLPFPAAAFDLVLLFTVFTSILDPSMARNIADEVERVLRPGGAIIWYDFRYDNPRNPHVRKMTWTDIQSLFPRFALELRPVTLLPPLARRLGPATRMLYPLLSAVPALRTHYVGLLTQS